jgi:hypothetical protein
MPTFCLKFILINITYTSWNLLNAITKQLIMHFQNRRCVAWVKVTSEQ